MGKYVKTISKCCIWGVDFLMIFVTLGTQDKSFKRLLKAIDECITKGVIKDKVIVQAGYTKYNSKNMEIFDLIDKDDFTTYIKECDLLISHGGVGSILTGLKNNKKVIAAPRLAKYNEHMNDHQVQIVNKFSKENYILAYNEKDDLAKIITASKKFQPKKYLSNTENMIKILTDFIDNN